MRKAGVLVLVALILAGSLVWVANIVSDTMLNIKNKGYVTVKGYAKQEIKSDLGILETTVIVENPDLKSCYEKLSQDMKKVEDLLKNKPEKSVEKPFSSLFSSKGVIENLAKCKIIAP